MLTIPEGDKLLHDVKRAAKVLSFIREEVDHEKRQTLIGLMIDEMDRLGNDILEIMQNGGKNG